MKHNLFIYDDEIRLSAVLETPDEREENRPLVIQLHGFTSSKDREHNLLAAAAMRSAGFATLRFDLYGHGESGGAFRKHTLFKWISNTMTVIDYAREAGYTRLYLAGHSQGGLVAALVAGMEADRIRGLILRAPAFGIPQWAREGNMLGQAFDPNHIPDTVPTIKGLELDSDYIRVAQMIHVEDAVDRYSGPVLLLHGDQDDVIPLSDSQRMAQRYRQCELAAITCETHHFNQHPQQMQSLIRNWLRNR